MKIKKIYQGTAPDNKILNTHSTSQLDTYSCDYLNNNSRIQVKTLFAGGVETSNCVTAVGAVARLNESFKNFDLIFIRIGTRIWTWTSKYEMLLASKINIGTGSNVRFVIPYSCYQGGTIYTIELGFTSETTLQIYYNSCVNTSGNGGYISEIYGVKFNTL